MMNLQQKTALVTGASSGIGEAFAYLLASKGTNLVLVARNERKLKQIASDITSKHGVTVKVYGKDLSQPNAASELLQQTTADSLTVDLLINNAGFGKWGPFEAFTMATYQEMIQLNVTALMELCYVYLPQLKQRPEAGIINVGSTASLLPVPYSSVYGATKSFVLFFTEGLAGELGGTNVTASCLCPSATASNFAAVASDNAHSKAADNQLTSAQVAQLGLDAFLAKKHYTITGRKMAFILARILSRRKIINMVATYWKKRLNL